MNPEDIDHPADRILAIERSMRCLVYGALGLLPALGVVFGVLAFFESSQVQALRGGRWNPARRCQVAGLTFAIIGFLLSAIGGAVAVLAAMESYL